MIKKGTVILILIAIGFFASDYYWSISPHSENSDKQKYQMAAIIRGPLIRTVVTDGRVEPNFVVEVKSKASGEIVRLFYEEGDSVKKENLLVELDPSDEKRNLRKMQSNLAAASARLAKAKSERATAAMTIPANISEARAKVMAAEVAVFDAKNKFKRAKNLDQKKIVSEEFLENAETVYKKAASDHEYAKAVLQKAEALRISLEEHRHEIDLAKARITDANIVLEEARERLADTRIKAPIDGVIIRQLVEQGQIISSGITNVSGGTTLLHIADLSRIFVVASVDETDIGQVEVGQEVQLTADAYLEKTFQGKVVHIAPEGVIESNVTTFNVKIEVLGEKKGLLKPAMSVNVEIIADRRDDILMVVSAAIKNEKLGTGKLVFRMEDGNPVAVSIKTGIMGDTHTEILHGIKEGTEVLANVVMLARGGAQKGIKGKSSGEQVKNMRRFMYRLKKH